MASLMRRPQAYMSAKQVRWIGFLTAPRTARTWGSDRTVGSRRCFGGRILFSPEQRRVALQRPTIEELDAAVVGLEGAECYAPLTQAEEIDANLILAQFVGRAAVVRGQVTNPVNVDGLGSRRQSGGPHVFDHSLTQRYHGGFPFSSIGLTGLRRPTRKIPPTVQHPYPV